MALCDVCGKPSLLPEHLGGSNICKVCFLKISGPLWKYKTYERFDELDEQRRRVIENAEKLGFSQIALEGINTFFEQQTMRMMRCDACGVVVQSLEQVEHTKLCRACFSKVHLDDWDNEEPETNRCRLKEIALQNNFPQNVKDALDAYYEKSVSNGVLYVMKGIGQTLRVYDGKLMLETHVNFSAEELAPGYAKMKTMAQSNALTSGADSVVSEILSSGVVKTGVSLATNVVTGTVVSQISGRSELFATKQGVREIPFENCTNVELIAPVDSELACIRIVTKDSKTAQIFLFRNNLKNVNNASRLCSHFTMKIHEAASAPLMSAAIRQATAPAQEAASVAETPAVPASAPVAPAKETSVADEILKFKSLLDMGVITQEEFETKKKQLLGL